MQDHEGLWGTEGWLRCVIAPQMFKSRRGYKRCIEITVHQEGMCQVAGGCAGLFSDSRNHEREERVVLELGLVGWIKHPLYVASLAETLLLGQT